MRRSLQLLRGEVSLIALAYHEFDIREALFAQVMLRIKRGLF
jgi:hypothetical protein